MDKGDQQDRIPLKKQAVGEEMESGESWKGRERVLRRDTSAVLNGTTFPTMKNNFLKYFL